MGPILAGPVQTDPNNQNQWAPDSGPTYQQQEPPIVWPQSLAQPGFDPQYQQWPQVPARPIPPPAPVALPNEYPDINRLRTVYAKSVIAREQLDEASRESEEMKKLKEHVRVLQKGVSLIKGADEIIDMNAFSIYPEARLPQGFKLPSITKFTGTTPPKTHLQSYIRSMQVSSCGEPELAQAFHMTLTGATLRWFFDLERHHTQTWGDIVKEFMTKYRSNENLEITRKHLEMAKQGEKESFSDFVTRWR
ncbi:hypothetical protein LguiA_007482 [Lonicera macranthoides]